MKHAKRRVGLYVGCSALGLLSLAVWGKMRFVTNLPRMAYAVPEQGETDAYDAQWGQAPLDDAPKASESKPPETGELD